MAKIKSYTDLEQSRKLAEILPIESADMYYDRCGLPSLIDKYVTHESIKNDKYHHLIPCWSLTALLKYLSEIKPQVYTYILFPSEGKWILHFVKYGHDNVCNVSCYNPVDACVAMIEKLHELKML